MLKHFIQKLQCIRTSLNERPGTRSFWGFKTTLAVHRFQSLKIFHFCWMHSIESSQGALAKALLLIIHFPLNFVCSLNLNSFDPESQGWDCGRFIVVLHNVRVPVGVQGRRGRKCKKCEHLCTSVKCLPLNGLRVHQHIQLFSQSSSLWILKRCIRKSVIYRECGRFLLVL